MPWLRVCVRICVPLAVIMLAIGLDGAPRHQAASGPPVLGSSHPAEGRDGTARFDPLQPPWSTIGRISIDNALCHAVLVGPQEILTAAHCLWDRKSRRWVDAKTVVFHAGLSGNGFGLETAVAEYRVAAGARMTPEGHVGDPARDVAVLRIVAPLGNSLGWLDPWEVDETSYLAFWRSRAPFMHLSFGNEAVPRASVNRACGVSVPYPMFGVFYADCPIKSGDSGSPMLVRTGSEFAIAGLHIGRITTPHIDFNVTVVGKVIARQLRELRTTIY